MANTIRTLSTMLAAAAVLLSMRAADARIGSPWTLHYGFGTGICGGTWFDTSTDRRFRLVTNYCAKPRGETTGVLSDDQFRRLQRAVEASHPDTWSTSYAATCIEHYAALSLSRPQPGRAPTLVEVRWGCGLTGVPSDLRALIVAVRSVATDLFPSVHLDTVPSLEAIPVSAHHALTIVSRQEYAPRTLELGADGSVRGRSRTSAGLYPVLDCPARAIPPVDPGTLAKLRVLETADAAIAPGTSHETESIFASAMSDCPAVAYGYLSPDVHVPDEVRWILFYVHAPRESPSRVPSSSIWIDDQGRFRAESGNGPVHAAVNRAAVGELDRAIGAAHETSWASGYPLGPAECLDSFYVIRIDRMGHRRAGKPVDFPCDGAGAPADAHAIATAANALLLKALQQPSIP